MPLAHLNAHDMFYQVEGNPAHPALIFSNSLGTDHTMWQAQATALSRDFYVIRYDTRGHGKSSCSEAPFVLADLGHDVLALLDFLNISSAHFCGISMGGLIGQWLAVHGTHRLKNLVLANTAAKIGQSDAWLTRADHVLQAGMQAIADSAASRWFTPSFIEQHPALVQRLCGQLANQNALAYARCCEMLATADMRDELHCISNPMCLIVGEFDPVTTITDALSMQARIPAAKLVMLPASHISNIEAEKAFTQALASFFLFAQQPLSVLTQ